MTNPTPPTTQDSDPSRLSAPKWLLMGPPGSGKTWATASLLKEGIETFVLITEPNGTDALLDACRQQNVPIDKLHWHYVSPVKVSMKSMIQLARTINSSSFEDIANMKMGIEKTSTTNIMQFLMQLENFEDQKDGKKYGSPFDWGFDRAFIVDSLSGLNNLVMQNTIGLKPNPAPGEWNIAMSFEENLTNKLVSDLQCYFGLIAHVDRNINEVTGGMVVTPAAIGAKLGPRLGKYFGDVIQAKRQTTATGFKWSTLEQYSDVKNSVLKIKNDIDPSYAIFVHTFEARRKMIEANQPGAQK